jgi:hypothetical protein
MNRLWLLLDLYSHEHPESRVTNLQQIFSAAEQGYPHHFHRRFLAFGENAGFTNSFYEKYTFLPPGVTSRWTEGDILLMNARPYPGPYGGMARGVISKADKVYHQKQLEEERIQQLFREAGILEPKPDSMPPPPPPPPETEYKRPLSSRVRGAVMDFLLLQGLSEQVAFVIWWILLSVPLIALVSIGLWMWRQRRSQDPPSEI